MAQNTSVSMYNKNLLEIDKALENIDVKRLCFTLRDCIAHQSLEKVKRGLDLFRELKKKDRLNEKDVRFLLELLQAVGRKDLFKSAKMKTWPQECNTNYSEDNKKISKYRYLLLDIARMVTEEDQREMKHLASDVLKCNVEDITDVLQLLILLEKSGEISKDDVSILHDLILSNHQIQEVIKVYEDTNNLMSTKNKSTDAPQRMDEECKYDEEKKGKDDEKRLQMERVHKKEDEPAYVSQFSKSTLAEVANCRVLPTTAIIHPSDEASMEESSMQSPVSSTGGMNEEEIGENDQAGPSEDETHSEALPAPSDTASNQVDHNSHTNSSPVTNGAKGHSTGDSPIQASAVHSTSGEECKKLNAPLGSLELKEEDGVTKVEVVVPSTRSDAERGQESNISSSEIRDNPDNSTSMSVSTSGNEESNKQNTTVDASGASGDLDNAKGSTSEAVVKEEQPNHNPNAVSVSASGGDRESGASGDVAGCGNSIDPDTPLQKEKSRIPVPKALKKVGKKFKSPFKKSSEETEIVKMHYITEKLKIIKENPIELHDGQLRQSNRTPSDQKATFSRTETRTTTKISQWSWDNKIAVKLDATFKTGIPILAEGGISVGLEDAFSIGHKKETKNAKAITWAVTIEGNVKSMTELTATLEAEEKEFTMPFEATLRKGNKTWRERGTFKGIQAVSAGVKYESKAIE